MDEPKYAPLRSEGVVGTASRPGNRTPRMSANGVAIGRPPGALNKGRGEAKAFCQEVIRSEEYKMSVRARARAGTLPAAVETLLWHYAYGKPVEHVQLQTGSTVDLSELTTEQLAERATFIAGILRDSSNAQQAAEELDRRIDEDARVSFDNLTDPATVQ